MLMVKERGILVDVEGSRSSYFVLEKTSCDMPTMTQGQWQDI